MAKATQALSKKVNKQGEYPILVRLDITRTNRPQFKSNIAVLPEYFSEGEIRIPMRGKLNAAFRDELLKKKTDIEADELLKKKTDIEAFIASLQAIAMALPDEVRTRKDILEVYEVVKSVNPVTLIGKAMQTTAIGTVANSLPENEVILLTLLISGRYIPYTDLRNSR